MRPIGKYFYILVSMFFHKNVHSHLSESCKSECPKGRVSTECLLNQESQGEVREMVCA